MNRSPRVRPLLAALALVCALAGATASLHEGAIPDTKSSARANAIAMELGELLKETDSQGGWETWFLGLAPFRKSIRDWLEAEEGRAVLTARDGRSLYERGSLLVISSDSPDTLMPQGNRPYVVIADFDKQLKERGIDLIFVPVPYKGHVYPEELVEDYPEETPPGVYWKALMVALLDSDIEVIDLLPTFLEAKRNGADYLFHRTDMHWSSEAMGIAAREIAERLSRYGYTLDDPQRQYRLRSEADSFLGLSAKRLQLTEEAQVEPETVEIVRVETLEGEAYSDVEDSPVLIGGGSYAVFRGPDAGLTARIAYEINAPVTLIGRDGGGPQVPWMVRREPPEFLEGRKVLVWICYLPTIRKSKTWQPVELP